MNTYTEQDIRAWGEFIKNEFPNSLFADHVKMAISEMFSDSKYNLEKFLKRA